MKAQERDDQSGHEAPLSGDRRSRMITDGEGRLWRVREVQFADAPASLIFESDAGFRRVRIYPAQWLALAEGDLYALSWQT